jgi:hypothetical protein
VTLSPREKSVNLGQQLRNRFRGRRPQDVVIDIEIGVNQPMTHAGDECPRNLRMLLAEFSTDLTRGFSHNLDGVKQCKRQHRIVV